MPKHIIRHQPRENPSVRLFCFPYAGGSAAVYRVWNAEFPPEIEICAVEIPGRIQLRTPPANSMSELIQQISPDIEALLDRPFVFFGHSFGSIIAYELTKYLQQKNQKLPEHLYVSSRRAPQIPLQAEPTYHLPDAKFIDAMQNQYNAIPDVVLKEKELLALLLPILRADIKLNETYVGELNPLISVPLTVLYGREDNSISRADLEKWCETTTAPCELKEFPGGHFFIDSERKSVSSLILEKVVEY